MTLALVTGGSRGIGLACARRLAAAGRRVVIAARNAARAEKAAAALPGSGHRGLACDVGDADAVRALFAELGGRHAPLTSVIHAAGVTSDQLLVRASDAALDDVVRTNLLGAMYVARAAVQPMLAQARKHDAGASIVLVSSIVGLDGNKGQTAYAASKAGLVGLTRSLAKEYGARGIRVNCLAPGFIETDMTHEMGHEARQAICAQTPLGRLGSVDDVADAALFLDAAPFVTGQVLRVDGGLTIA